MRIRKKIQLSLRYWRRYGRYILVTAEEDEGEEVETQFPYTRIEGNPRRRRGSTRKYIWRFSVDAESETEYGRCFDVETTCSQV